ncbi:hypothetical protein [Dubosiella newyorkensis]|uniref:Uncharacterized protein n=1 Tax=Dubosiella newyorkensis TaxID=1862672 RepID=A0A1U7NN20_9FIRM|nr:hypothetical protein [Dubosiella newyorkensis]OLU46683.1 hypothetical protein BO225_05825 [Dubosiella newyorkensis]
MNTINDSGVTATIYSEPSTFNSVALTMITDAFQSNIKNTQDTLEIKKKLIENDPDLSTKEKLYEYDKINKQANSDNFKTLFLILGAAYIITLCT